MKKGIFAILAVLIVAAMVTTSCDDGSKPKAKAKLYTITFKANGGTGTAPAAITQKTAGETITLPGKEGLTGPTAKPNFAGWGTSADAVTSVGATYKPTKNTDLYAIWGTGSPPVQGLDIARAEKVSVANNWHPVYRFELPADKTWADYKGLSASYMFETADLATARSRNGRLIGPYEPSDFAFTKGTAGTDGEGKNFMMVDLNSQASGHYIDNGAIANSEDAGSLLTELAKKGITAVGDQWFTYDLYDITGTNKNGNLTNYPADDATGVFYFALGLPGAGSDKPPNVYYVRDVTLIGYEATDNVIATPLWFEVDGVNVPAFLGYPTPDGTNGFSSASRKQADNSAPAKVIPWGAEKVAVANNWHPIYKFDLDGKKWEDFQGLSVDYMFEAADLATARSRNGRLIGNYDVNDFALMKGTDDAAGKNFMMVSLNSQASGHYIDNGAIANSEDAGSLLTELAKKGITAVGGQWFTYDLYDITGTNKNGDLTNYPKDDYDEVLYFAIGLPGAGSANPPNVYYVKNITLIGFEEADNVIATPAYLPDPDDTDSIYPAFLGYPTVSGGDGFRHAYRGTAK